MATVAKSAFDVNIERAGYFLDIHQWGQGGSRGAPAKPLRELPRGAVVFAIGALDAYLSEVSAEVIVHDLQRAVASHDTRELLKRVQGELPTLALEVALVHGQAERVQRIQDGIVDYFHNRASMHGAKAVSATVGRIGSRSVDAWSALGSKGFPGAQEQLDRWTEIRHQIVHQGKKPQVLREQARKCLALISKIVETVDSFAVT